MSASGSFPIYPPGVAKYANFAAFPVTAANGALALDLSTDTLYAFNTGSMTWVVIGGGGVALSVGTIDSVAASLNGASISANQLFMQSASATDPGLVNLAAQTMAGAKTFSTSVQSPIFKSSTANPASAGVVRLSNTDAIDWRNAGNSANLGLTLDASNVFQLGSALTVNGSILPAVDFTYNLGSTLFHFNNVYYEGMLSGGQANIDIIVGASGNSYFSESGNRFLEIDLGPTNNTDTLLQFTSTANGRVITFFNASDTVVGRNTTDNLTNKTLASQTANPATAGVIRLANTDAVEWRNAANSANLSLLVDASNTLNFSGGAGFTLNGATSGAITQLASAVTTGYSITWPSAQSAGTAFLQNNGAGVLSWVAGTSGTVTSLSVVSANGLAGTVATPTTTPAITLSTTVTGILQGNGTAISAATTGDLTDAGTDGIVITSGTGAVLGSGTSIAQHVADATHNGYLSSADWNTFNGKGTGSVTSVSVVTANGVSGTVATPTTTPAITLTLGAITPSSVAASGTVTGSNLSGTNTGDVTLAAVGASPNANAASLSGQVLNLQPFDSTHPGVVTASGGGTTNFLRADGTWAAAGGSSTTSTQWASYTLAITATTTNPTEGTVTFSQARWRRVGDSMDLRVDYSENGGTAGSGIYLFNLPPGPTIDTAKITTTLTATSNGRSPVVGNGLFSNNGTITSSTQVPVWAFVYDTSNIALGFTNPASGNNIGGLIGRDLGDLSGVFFVSFTVHGIPISGWTNNN